MLRFEHEEELRGLQEKPISRQDELITQSWRQVDNQKLVSALLPETLRERIVSVSCTGVDSSTAYFVVTGH